VQDGEDLALSLMKAVNAQNEEETARLLDIYRRQDDSDPDIVLFAEANQAVFRDDLKAALAKYRELYRFFVLFVYKQQPRQIQAAAQKFASISPKPPPSMRKSKCLPTL